MSGKIDRTCFLAGAAGDACFFLPVNLHEAEAVEPAVDRPQRAEVLAERAEYFYGKHQDHDQDSKLPEKESSDLASQQFIGREQRQRPQKRAGGTQIFAECRNSGEAAEQEHGADAYEKQKNRIFSICEDSVKRQSLSFLKNRDPVQKILHQPERTEPSAYSPSQKASEEEEKAQYPERDLKSVLV